MSIGKGEGSHDYHVMTCMIMVHGREMRTPSETHDYHVMKGWGGIESHDYHAMIYIWIYIWKRDHLIM